MPLRVHCPTGHVLMVPDERAGRAVKCPRCQQVVMVPQAAARFDGDNEKNGPAAPASPPAKRPTLPAKPPAKAAVPATKPVPPAATVPKKTAPPPTKAAAKPSAPPPQKQETRPPARPAPPPSKTSAPVQQRPPATPPRPEQVQQQKLDAQPAAAAITAAKSEPPKGVPTPAIVQAPAAPPPSAAPPPQAPTPPVPPPTEAPAPPPIANSGPEPEQIVPPPAQVAGAYQLAGIMVAVALFSMGPAAWETLDYLRSPDLPLDKWALILITLGLVQIAYAAFIAQIPDWTSAWVVSIMSLTLAGGYGALLGIAVMSAEESGLIQTLQLSHEMADQKVTFWAIAMICSTSLLSWYAGHCSSVWHRTESVLRRAGLAVQ